MGDSANIYARLRKWVGRNRVPLLIALLSLAWFGALQHEIRSDPPDLNDQVLHLTLATGVTEALPDLAKAFDPWELSPGMGFPSLHYYQHLPSFFLVAVHKLFPGQAPLVLLLRTTMVLLLAAFPLVIYASMRRFGMGVLPSALAAVLALLISDGDRFGWRFESYLWSGQGMYTQLWGMFLLPLAVSWGYVYLKEGKGRFGAVTFLVATCLSHLVTGIVAVISLCAIFMVIDTARGHWTVKAKRLVLLFGLVGLIGSYFFIPFVLDGPYMNRSVWEQAYKYDSFGHQSIIRWLLTGQLLDAGRYVPLTLFLCAGIVAAIWRWRDERNRIGAVLFFVFLALYCGRPTWGKMLDLLPFSRDMHFHRFIIGVHFASLMLAGLGAAALYELIRRAVPRFKSVVAATVIIALLAPAFVERGHYLKQNSKLIAQSREAFKAEKGDVQRLLSTLQALPPARVFAGLPGMWGKDIRVGAVPVYALLQARGFDCLAFCYHAMSLNCDIQYLFDENSLSHYGLFNVAYVVADQKQKVPPFLKHIVTIGRFAIYEADTGGHIGVVSSSIGFAGTKRDWFAAASAWLNGPWFRAGDYPRIRLTQRVSSAAQELPLAKADEYLERYSGVAAPAPGAVLRQSKTTYQAGAVVAMSRPGYVIFRSTYHPNWSVRVDGARKEAVMLMPSYMGVAVPQGQHDVSFTYEPSDLRPWLFAMGCGILVVLVFIGRRHAKGKLGDVAAGVAPPKQQPKRSRSTQ